MKWLSMSVSCRAVALRQPCKVGQSDTPSRGCTRARVFACPQTYGLRKTSVPSIATEPGRPNSLPTPATATTSGDPFRPRASPEGWRAR